MEYSLLIKKIIDQHSKGLPFTLYALPGEEILVCYLQKDKVSHNIVSFIDNGMVLAPFNSEKPKYFIPADQSQVIFSEFIPKKLPLEELTISEAGKDRIRHEQLITDAKIAIQQKKAHKIVVSRSKKIQLKSVELDHMIYRLLNFFPDAFRYVWFHPETGIWCGASPELLVKTDGIAFSTMALAGTKKIGGHFEPDWTSKEIIEQEYVTEAITDCLQKVTSIIKISKTVTHRAGPVAHLRTDITGILKKGKATLESVSETLHPTPAVCGTPQKFAKEFILEKEGYDREFYTGFVGPVNRKDSNSFLFVNLRCAKIENDIASLYVGGGITSDSVPESEWVETQNKLQSMLQVLHPFMK